MLATSTRRLPNVIKKQNSLTKWGIACLSHLELCLDVTEWANLWTWLSHRLSWSLDLCFPALLSFASSQVRSEDRKRSLCVPTPLASLRFFVLSCWEESRLQYILWVFGILNSLDSKEFHIELEREILVVSKKFKIGVQHLKKVLCRNFGKTYRPKV